MWGKTKARTLLVGGLLAPGALAFAADIAPPPDRPAQTSSYKNPQAGDDQDVRLDEIVVTARKRKEALIAVPDSITAFSAQQIEDARIEKIEDFIALTPNFEIHHAESPGVFLMSIRGISQANKGDAPVAMVVDGVTLPYSNSFTMPLFDVEDIQVLKGPQGALYGQNSLGGAVIINTRQPTDTFEGNAQVSLGRGPEVRTQAVVSGPIVPGALLFRVGALYDDTPGLVPYAYIPHRNTDYRRNKDARIDLEAIITPTLTSTLSGDWSRTGWGNNLSPESMSFGSGIPGVSTAQVNSNIVLGRPSQDTLADTSQDIADVSLKTAWDSGFGTFTSITAAERLHETNAEDLDISHVPFVRLARERALISAWEQELRYSSPDQQRLRWMVGAFAQQVHRQLNDDNIQVNAALFGPPPVDISPGAAVWVPAQVTLQNQQLNAYAVSAQASYDVTPLMELTVAGRYDRAPRSEQDTNTAGSDSAAALAAGTTPRRSHTFQEFEPKVSLAYKLDEDARLYATYSKGFRPGGFNGYQNANVAATFPAEITKNLELGAKFNLFEHRVSLDLAAFYNIYNNQQQSLTEVNSSGGGTQAIFTIDKTVIKGFELALQARPAHGLDIGIGFGYTDAIIDKFGNSLSGAAFDPRAYVGKTVPLVSRYTLNASVQYTVPVAAGTDGFVRLDFYRKGKLYWFPDNNYAQHPYNIVDGQVGARLKQWSFDLYARNVFNQKYNVLFFDNRFVGAPGGFNFGFPALPRTYGVEAKYQF